jgi:hypothetical protein
MEPLLGNWGCPRGDNGSSRATHASKLLPAAIDILQRMMAMNVSRENDMAEQGALATLSVLEDLVFPERVYGRDVVLLLPSLRPLERHSVVSLLVQQRRPVSCIAMAFNDALAIGWLATNPDDAGWEERRSRDLIDSLESLLRECSPDEKDIALVTSRKTIRFSAAKARKWLLDYNFPLTILRLQPPTPELAESGFGAVLRVLKARGDVLSTRVV